MELKEENKNMEKMKEALEKNKVSDLEKKFKEFIIQLFRFMGIITSIALMSIGTYYLVIYVNDYPNIFNPETMFFAIVLSLLFFAVSQVEEW